MVNFIPLKNYLLFLIGTFITRYNLRGPFLDVGGGTGDVSLFFLNRGIHGKYIDYSPDAYVLAKEKLRGRRGIRLEKKHVLQERGTYRIILLLDVLEHVTHDKKVIDHVYSLLYRGGYVILSVPIKKKEWRKDDFLYGHLRRYEITDIQNILKKFEIVEMCDFTFPIFWAMRRIYSWFISAPKEFSPEKLSKKSSIETHYFDFFHKYMGHTFLWKPIWFISYPFRNTFLGHEVLILARKRE